MAPQDTFGRPLRSLRVSVTDRCNLRCSYCMPEEEYAWLPRASILSFEETTALVRIFAGLGVEAVRFTGGEPLLRRDLPVLVRQVAAEPRIRDLAMTTNGVLLEEQAGELRRAGLHRVSVSLDTLRADRFQALTRRPDLPRVLAGIEAVRAAGFQGSKLDTVVIRGFNEDELPDLIAFGRETGFEVRFIEYMDVGGATRWTPEQVVSQEEILGILADCFGPVKPVREVSSAPARRHRLPDGTVFGTIASTTRPFCASCDRSRLTADGRWYLCLYAREGVDLRGLLRAGAGPEAIAARIRPVWRERADRGAEERLALAERTVLPPSELRTDPHLEMHTRGG